MKKAKGKGRRGRSPKPTSTVRAQSLPVSRELPIRARKGQTSPLLSATEEVGGLPAVPDQVFQTCPIHASVTYRIGGFCEKCYADTSMDRVKAVDDALAETVVSKFASLVQQVLNSGQAELVERFLGRVMARFDKPKQTQVSATLKAVHLHAPVDFGAKHA